MAVVIIPLVTSNKSLTKFVTVFILMLSIILIHVAVKFGKVVYQNYEGMPNPPLWVPKAFGYGISVNPYNKVGKIITIALTVILDLFFIGTGIAILYFS
ncbi:hypothetical protein [Lactobacillus helveticus]|nr:hypothetical protein [Lactobacillus helveticus]